MAKISKILYIITQAELGGAQGYIFDLASKISDPDHLVSVAAGEGYGLLEKFKNSQIATYKIKNLKREISPISDILAYFEIKKLIKQINPDIIHLNSSKAGVLGALAAHQAGIKKIIYTAHGFVFNEPLPWWKKQMYLFAEKFSARYKSKIICVSEFDRQTGLKNNIAEAEKFVTIHNGIDQLHFLDKPTARQQLSLPLDKIVIGTVANFYPTKGLTYLIDAAKIVTTKNPNIIFRLIGFGQLETDLKIQIKELSLEQYFFLGAKKKAYHYLKAFDIFVLSSVKEGLSYTILEAMRAGLPIVATAVGGTPEMITGSNWMLVNSKDPQALAEAILKLINNKTLADQLGAKAAIDVANNFSLEHMITKTIQVYQE